MGLAARARHAEPDGPHLVKIANALDVTLPDLLEPVVKLTVNTKKAGARGAATTLDTVAKASVSTKKTGTRRAARAPKA